MKLYLPDSLVLRDIHVPPAPSWWPPAPGWWVLLALLGAALIGTYLYYRRTGRRNSWRTQVLMEIQRIAATYPNDDAGYAASLHQLLRRASARYATNAHHAQGEPWRQVLGQVPVDEATLDTLMTLETRMYQPRAAFDRPLVHAAAHRWLETGLRRVPAMMRSPGDA